MRRKHKAIKILATFTALAGGATPFYSNAESKPLPSIELNFEALEKLKISNSVKAKKTNIHPEAELKNSNRIVTPELKPEAIEAPKEAPKLASTPEPIAAPVKEEIKKPAVVIKQENGSPNENINASPESQQEVKQNGTIGSFFSNIFSKKSDSTPTAEPVENIPNNASAPAPSVENKKTTPAVTVTKPKKTTAENKKTHKEEKKQAKNKTKTSKEDTHVAKLDISKPTSTPAISAPVTKEQKKDQIPPHKVENIIIPEKIVPNQLSTDNTDTSREVIQDKILTSLDNASSPTQPKDVANDSTWNNFLEKTKNKIANTAQEKPDAVAAPEVITKESKIVVEKEQVRSTENPAKIVAKTIENPPVAPKEKNVKNIEKPLGAVAVQNIKAPPVPEPLAITPSLEEKMAESSEILNKKFGDQASLPAGVVENKPASTTASVSKEKTIAPVEITPEVPAAVESQLEMVVVAPPSEEIKIPVQQLAKPEPKVAEKAKLQETAKIEPQETIKPQSPNDSKVDKNLLLKITFAGNDTNLNATDKDKITKIVKESINSNNRLKVMSYASGIDGEVNSARRISLQRAISIRSQMIAAGLDKSRINVQAIGSGTDEALANSANISIVE